MRRRGADGFTLIELMLVVAVLAVLFAIGMSNFLNALQRARQMGTMTDMNSIGKAMETYSIDNSYYPSTTTMADLKGVLEPMHISLAPLNDGWGHAFLVTTTSRDYTVGSGGRDGGTLNYVGGEIDDFDDAIILVNGQFIQWPEGQQQ